MYTSPFKFQIQLFVQKTRSLAFWSGCLKHLSDILVNYIIPGKLYHINTKICFKFWMWKRFENIKWNKESHEMETQQIVLMDREKTFVDYNWNKDSTFIFISQVYSVLNILKLCLLTWHFSLGMSWTIAFLQNDHLEYRWQI